MHARLLLLSLLSACAGPIITVCHDHGAPYTSERPTQPFRITTGGGMYGSWFADGPPKVLIVHNPTEIERLIHVICHPTIDPTDIDYGHVAGWFDVPAHSELIQLVEFLAIDALTPVCHVADAWALGR